MVSKQHAVWLACYCPWNAVCVSAISDISCLSTGYIFTGNHHKTWRVNVRVLVVPNERAWIKVLIHIHEEFCIILHFTHPALSILGSHGRCYIIIIITWSCPTAQQMNIVLQLLILAHTHSLQSPALAPVNTTKETTCAKHEPEFWTGRIQFKLRCRKKKTDFLCNCMEDCMRLKIIQQWGNGQVNYILFLFSTGYRFVVWV